jgi:hypothetical protein
MHSTVNSIFHVSYFDPDYPTDGLTVTGLERAYCTLYIHQFENPKFNAATVYLSIF